MTMPLRGAHSSSASSSAMEDVGVRWWDRHFSSFGERIPFKSLFFPLLLKLGGETQQTSPLSQMSEQLSLDELTTLVKFCVAENAWKHGFVTKRDFLYFVARFGPLELCVSKVVSCFCANRELVPWFHGVVGRAESERVLAAGGDGAFLIRFSETHPTKFTLSYVKIHTAPPHTGRREMKNCLIENLGHQGYVLTDSKSRAYSSILSFVQRSAGRLKHGVGSALAKQCNSELADIRALQDQQSNSYTAFSAETLDMADALSPTRGRALLFAQSPPRSYNKSDNQQQGFFNSDASNRIGSDCCADSYSGFALDALTPPPLSVKLNPPASSSLASSAASFVSTSSSTIPSDDDYGDASAYFNNDASVRATENNQQSRNSPSPQHAAAIVGSTGGVDESADYGSFLSLTTATNQSLASHSPPTKNTLSPSHRDRQLPQFGLLVSPSRRRHDGAFMQQEDAYGTFESFASTFAAESEQLAQRNGFALSFSKTNQSMASAFSRGDSSSNSDDAYGSFASLSVTKPTQHSIDNNNQANSGDEYGHFESLVDSSTDEFSSFSLGPPPPPPTASHFQPSPPTTSSSDTQKELDSDMYGSFAALDSSSSPEEAAAVAAGSAETDEDVYGSFETLLNSTSASASPVLQFPVTSKVKETSILAQATASRDSDTTPAPMVTKEHAHSAACSALDELNAGMAFYQQKHLDDALACFIHAQEVAKVANNQVVEARALGNLGTVYLDKKNPQQAVVCYQRCLDITRSIKDTKRERTILNNLVLALMACDEFARALQCCAVQLEMTTNEINRRKILSRMSLLRERVARAKNKERGAATGGGPVCL